MATSGTLRRSDMISFGYENVRFEQRPRTRRQWIFCALTSRAWSERSRPRRERRDPEGDLECRHRLEWYHRRRRVLEDDDAEDEILMSVSSCLTMKKLEEFY